METVETCPRCGSGPIRWVISTRLRTFFVCVVCNHLFSVPGQAPAGAGEETR